MTAQTYRKLSDLPAELAVFPLEGALLLPRWHLPLNIFEPRYLNMIDDAMMGTRLIGMVQTMGGVSERPVLASVGCAGRVTRYEETGDGRYLITLTGIARFTLAEELTANSPYRVVTPAWGQFKHDLAPEDVAGLPSRNKLVSALKAYVARSRMDADWSDVDEVSMDTLINALCAGCPFSSLEKQALLEAKTLRDRCNTLIALLEMDTAGDEEGPLQ